MQTRVGDNVGRFGYPLAEYYHEGDRKWCVHPNLPDISRCQMHVIADTLGSDNPRKHWDCYDDLFDLDRAIRSDPYLQQRRIDNITPVVQVPDAKKQHRVGPWKNTRHLPEVIKTGAHIQASLRDTLDFGKIPIVLGGDDSLEIAVTSTISKRVGHRLAYARFDAHPDMHTPETTETGRIYGQSQRALFGEGHPDLVAFNGGNPSLSFDRTVWFGTRDRDFLLRFPVHLIHQTGARRQKDFPFDSKPIGHHDNRRFFFLNPQPHGPPFLVEPGISSVYRVSKTILV